MSAELPFHTLLARYRQAAGLTAESLAQRLGRSGRSVVTNWESDRARPRPTEVRQLARNLGLDADQTDEFIDAARRAAGPHRPNTAGYPPLSPTERANLKPMYAPGHLSRWRSDLARIHNENVHCDFALARETARTIFEQIERARGQDVDPIRTWKLDEQEEADRLAIDAVIQYSHAVSLTYPPEELATITLPLVLKAHQIAVGVDDPSLVALVDSELGNYYYALARTDPRYYTSALAVELKALPNLNDFSRKALAQRHVTVSSVVARPAALDYYVAASHKLADQAPPTAQHSRVRLLEGIGYALARAGSKRCLPYLDLAEAEAPGVDPLSCVMVLRSRMVWLTKHPNAIDPDEVRQRCTKALAVTEAFGWQRYPAQIHELAAKVHVSLN